MAALRIKASSGIKQHPFLSAAAHHAVCVLGEPLQCEQRVVRLNDHVTHLILVWENRVSLHQLLWIPEIRGKKNIKKIHTHTRENIFKQVACVFLYRSLSFSSR